MSKENREERAGSVAIPAEQEAGSRLPRWALMAGLVLLALGAWLYTPSDSRRKSSFIKALNSARVTVSGTEDGFQDDFAALTVETNRHEYLELQGACNSEPRMALAVFREILTNEKSGKEARMLACRLAYFLIQDGRLSDTERNEVLQLLAAQLDSTQSAEVRRVAQGVLSAYQVQDEKVLPQCQLIALRDVEKAKAYEKLPDPSAETKDPWLVQTREALREGTKVLVVRWSGVDACMAWWGRFGSKAVWDEKLKLFVIGAD